MAHPFQRKLHFKPPELLPKVLTCPRCKKLKPRGKAKEGEHEEDKRGHKCDKGCYYSEKHCFEDLSFDEDPHDNELFAAFFELHEYLAEFSKFCKILKDSEKIQHK